MVCVTELYNTKIEGRNAYFLLLYINDSSGADVDKIRPDERTPLHEAAERGYSSIVKLLSSKVANLVQRDGNDATPYDLAFKNDHKEVQKCQLHK